MSQVSAIIVCFNEEDNIRACLESVAWCDEIVVVDARSEDRTLDIVREFTDRIFVRDWPGYREQKQFALDQARLEWVLNLDADERVSPAPATRRGSTDSTFRGSSTTSVAGGTEAVGTRTTACDCSAACGYGGEAST